MEQTKLINLLEKTYQKTIEGKLIWEVTGRDNAFQAALPTGAFEIRKQSVQNIDYINFSIYNANGDLIESIDENQIHVTINDISGAFFLDRLFTAVRSKALNIDKTIDDILNDLNGK
jgi:hypothetical protein